MNKNRPVNLALTTMRFPITAIVSILHRMAGLLLFISIPFLLWALQASLASIDGFNALQQCLQAPVMRFILWVVLSALWYHLIAGIRHLLMDWGVGETKSGGKIGAHITLVLAVIAIVLTGVWLW